MTGHESSTNKARRRANKNRFTANDFAFPTPRFDEGMQADTDEEAMPDRLGQGLRAPNLMISEQ